MYSLLRAVNIVRIADSSASRMKVFLKAVENSVTIRFAFRTYERLPYAAKSILIGFYGMKCFLSLAWRCAAHEPIVYLAAYPSEHRVLNRVREYMGAGERADIALATSNCLSWGAIGAAVGYLRLWFRLNRIAARVVRRHRFMPACRIFSTFAYYVRCKQMLAEHPNVRGVFIANQYSPECMGLGAAAHSLRRKVLFTNHANATGETGYVAPMHADLLALTSEALADLYRRYSPGLLNVTTIPITTPQRKLQLPDCDCANITVGLFLTALTDEKRVQSLVSELAELPYVSSVFVRTHPAQVINPDLSSIRVGGVPLEISHAAPLFHDISRCDVAVCGSSTVAVELLRGGTPVLYDVSLDSLAFDYNGYLKRGLVCSYPENSDALLTAVREHYGSERWVSTMRYFDSSYMEDEAALADRFRKSVCATIATTAAIVP